MVEQADQPFFGWVGRAEVSFGRRGDWDAKGELEMLVFAPVYEPGADPSTLLKLSNRTLQAPSGTLAIHPTYISHSVDGGNPKKRQVWA
jgi:hypothetical protein